MMFRGCKARSINFYEKFNAKNVVNMASMFRYSAVGEINLSSFDTTNIKFFTDIFKGTYIDKGYA